MREAPAQALSALLKNQGSPSLCICKVGIIPPPSLPSGSASARKKSMLLSLLPLVPLMEPELGAPAGFMLSLPSNNNSR